MENEVLKQRVITLERKVGELKASAYFAMKERDRPLKRRSPSST